MCGYVCIKDVGQLLEVGDGVYVYVCFPVLFNTPTHTPTHPHTHTHTRDKPPHHTTPQEVSPRGLRAIFERFRGTSALCLLSFSCLVCVCVPRVCLSVRRSIHVSISLRAPDPPPHPIPPHPINNPIQASPHQTHPPPGMPIPHHNLPNNPPKLTQSHIPIHPGILHEGAIDKRVQYTIEGLFAVRKSAFADFPAVPEALDLVEKVGAGVGWVGR